MSTEHAPVEEQQANESLESALGAEYDRRAEEIEAEVVEVAGEEEVEVVEAADEVDDEVEIEASDEVVEEEPEYNEAAPERWPEELKTAYNDLPPEAKRAMMEGVYKPMQKTYTQTTQELAEQRKQIEPMLATLNQHSQEFEKAGINPIEAFNRQMAWSAHFAKVGPEQGAKDLADAYGQAGGQREDSNVYMTPVEKAQQAEIDRLSGKFDSLSNAEQQRITDQQSQAVEAQAQQVRGSIQTFANEMRDGKPVHPHIEKVSAHMAGLIKGGLVDRTDEYGQPVPYNQQLGQAYKLACDLDPNIRTTRLTQSRKEQVAKATAANRDVVSKTPGGDKVEDSRPLSESISDLYDRMDRSAVS
jgi:hypothetical protein